MKVHLHPSIDSQLVATNTLWLPLNKSWHTSSAPWKYFEEYDGEATSVNDAALWSDDTDKLYHWGGGYDEPIDERYVGLWVFTPGNNSRGTWELEESPDQSSYDIASAQSGGSTSCGRKGYFIGGYGGPWTDTKFAGSAKRTAVPGILTYDMTSRRWSNSSTEPISQPNGTIIAGKAVCTADSFQTPLIFSIGGRISDPNSTSTKFKSMRNITFWDTSQERWLWQMSDGFGHPQSEYSCIVGAASKNRTYEM